jgi:hypothetical protein
VPANTLKRFGSPVGSHRVDLHDDNTEFGHRYVLIETGKRIGNRGRDWVRIYILDDRIFFLWIEVRRPVDHRLDRSMSFAALLRNSRIALFASLRSLSLIIAVIMRRNEPRRKCAIAVRNTTFGAA